MADRVVTQPVLAAATLPEIRSMLDEARAKNYRAGVLGVQARLEWPGPAEFEHDGQPVRVVQCESSLAVREALLDRDPAGWLVVLTDRDDADLGHGLLGRLAWQRLRRLDPWTAVRQRFAASGIDPALITGAQRRALAAGLLAAAPADGWPPAPGGVLTRDHAYGAVARAHLGLAADGLAVDAPAVLAWSAGPDAAAHTADLRSLAGDPLTNVVLEWVAGQTGACAPPLRQLLTAGAVGEVLPLGLIAKLLVAARERSGGDAATVRDAQTARDGLIRLEARLGPTARDLPALRAWGGEAEAVVADLLAGGAPRATGHQVLAQADTALRELAAEPLAVGSDLLPTGLTWRFHRLADTLRTAVDRAAGRLAADPDRPLLATDDLATIEAAWSAVELHQLAGSDLRVPPFQAAVRLARWLSVDTTAGPQLASLVERHRAVGAHVDAAVGKATIGVDDSDLGSALETVLDVVRRRRDGHDAAFAAALAAHTADDPPGELAPSGRRHRGVRHLEDLLPDTVLPLTRHSPVLLLVLDGMSVAVAAEVMTDLLSDPTGRWRELAFQDEPGRGTALAVLPTLTDVSRTSLLCGELRTGQQTEERRGYRALTHAYGLAGAELFHKGLLDTSQPGHVLHHDVAAAIAKADQVPLVTCVLNAVDDALDRSNPGGTQWGRGSIRHLRALLDRAEQAGRIVVLTADHGHIIERRTGTQRPHPGISSGRSRPGDGKPAGDGEVLAAGRRVLRHDQQAVLAVDERLRYGPLKAGYHGGASPAEVIVPICVLATQEVPDEAGLQQVGPQEPDWWHSPLPAGRPAPTPPAAPPSLFDNLPEPATDSPASLVDAVLRSEVYRRQQTLAHRVAVDQAQVRDLLTALLAAPGHRLAPAPAAAALRVSAAALRGALAHVLRLLNVEGYPVLGFDPDGVTVVLDEPLLREQFGVES